MRTRAQGRAQLAQSPRKTSADDDEEYVDTPEVSGDESEVKLGDSFGKVRRRHRRVTAEQTKLARGAIMSGVLPQWNEARPDDVVESDPSLINLAKFEKIRHSFSLKTHVQPSTAYSQARHQLTSLPIIRSVTHTKTLRRPDTQRWRLKFQVAGTVKPLSLSIPYSMFTKEQLSPLIPIICDLWSRCPVASDTKRVEDLLMYLALGQLRANGVTYTLPALRQFSNKSDGDVTIYYEANVMLLDPATGVADRFEVRCAPSLLDDFEVPDLPPGIAFTRIDRVKAKNRRGQGQDKGGNEEQELEQEDDATPNSRFAPDMFESLSEDTPKHRAAIKILRLLQMDWEGRVANKDELRAAARLFKSQYERSKASNYQNAGPFGGNVLYRRSSSVMQREGGNVYKVTKIRPSRQLNDARAGGSPWLPIIIINSPEPCRANPVCDIIDHRFVATTDIMTAWYEACLSADYVNSMIKAGEPPQSFCSCSPTMALTTCHPCGICAARSLCAHLHTVEYCAQGICRTCFAKKEPNATEVPSEGAVSDADMLRFTLRRIKTFTRANVLAEVRHGLKLSGKQMKRADIKKLVTRYFKAIWEEIEKGCIRGSETEYTDFYSGSSYSVKKLGQNKRTCNPFYPTIEAVWPYTIADGRAIVHGPGNVKLVSFFLNTGKHVFVPGVLQILADFLNSSRDEDAISKLQKGMTDVCLVGMLSSFSKNERMKKSKKSTISYDKIKQAWLLARPTPETGTPAMPTWCENMNARRLEKEKHDKDWRPPGWSRFVKVVELIEAKFGITFARSLDGAPYPWEKETMPSEWNVWTAWRFFVERTHRMWLNCNGRWEQKDTPETIWLECLWQAANPEKKSQLALPLVVYRRHPLRVVIAHLRHGEAMWTGWDAEPTSLDDRHEEGCNISCETHLENMLKLNFDESEWEAIFEAIKNLKLDATLYSPEELSDDVVFGEAAVYDEDDLLDDADLMSENENSEGEGVDDEGSDGEDFDEE